MSDRCDSAECFIFSPALSFLSVVAICSGLCSGLLIISLFNIPRKRPTSVSSLSYIEHIPARLADIGGAGSNLIARQVSARTSVMSVRRQRKSEVRISRTFCTYETITAFNRKFIFLHLLEVSFPEKSILINQQKVPRMAIWWDNWYQTEFLGIDCASWN